MGDFRDNQCDMFRRAATKCIAQSMLSGSNLPEARHDCVKYENLFRVCMSDPTKLVLREDSDYLTARESSKKSKISSVH